MRERCSRVNLRDSPLRKKFANHENTRSKNKHLIIKNNFFIKLTNIIPWVRLPKKTI